MLLTGFVQFVAVVVAVEHLDGSAVAAKYTDQEGKRKWITHAYAERPFDDTPMPERTKQLMEVEKLYIWSFWTKGPLREHTECNSRLC